MRKIITFLILLSTVGIYALPLDINKSDFLEKESKELIVIPAIDGCSGSATFIATYDPANCCWTFQNTTTNDCMQWYCVWDFGDGSPTVSTPQGQTTVCHQFPGPGVYTVSLQFNSSACHGGSGGICIGSQNVTIPQLNLLSTESNYNGYNVSCEGANDGWISMSSVTNYTYEWPAGANTPWSVSQFGPTVNNLTAGVYTVLATGANGCTGSMTITLTEPTLTGTASIIDPSCFGYLDGSIDFTSSGGLSPFTYVWTGPNFTSNNEDPVGLAATNYNLILTDSYGCSETFNYILNEPTPISTSFITSDFNGYNISCYGDSNGSIDFTTTGSVPPYNFQWSSGQITEDINNLQSGTYSLLITDNNLCTKMDTIIINEPSPLMTNLNSSFNYNGYDISCYGDSNGGIDLTVSGSVPTYNYLWSTSSTNQNIFNLSAGMYSVDVIDINGCIISDSIALFQPSPLLSNISSIYNYNGFDISCYGFADGGIDLFIYGSVPPYMYNWNTNDTTQDLNNVSSSYYSVNITDANNCSSFQDIILSEPTPFSSFDTISYYNGVNISCNSFSDGYIDFDIIGSVPPYNYLWNTSSINQDVFNLSAGTYTVEVVDDNGCIFSDSFNLYEPLPITTSTIISSACYGDSNGSVNLSIIGGVPWYNIDWFGYNPDSLSTGTYSYSITDVNNCLYIDSVEVLQPSLPYSVIENVTDVNCYAGINGSVSLNISGSTSPYYVTWQNNINPNNLIAGVYYYDINDHNNCSYSDSILVSEPTPFSVIQHISDVSCFNGTDGTVSLNVTGGTPPYILDWGGVDTNNLQSGTYNFNITDQNNCIYSGITIINEPNPIDVIYSIHNPSCNNTNDGSISLTISGGVPPYSTNWLGQNPNQLPVGNLQFIVSDNNLCTDTNFVTLNAVSNISISEIIYEVSCKGFCDGEVDLIINNGIPPYFIDWNGDNPDSLCEGSFVYEITDSLGCVFSNNGIINAPDSLGLTLTLVTNQIIMANATGGNPPYSYNWFTNSSQFSTNQSITPSGPNTYYCVAFDVNHCQSDTMKIFYSDELGIDYRDIIGMILYPNPTSSVINLDFISIKEQDMKLYITNSLSQVIVEEKIENLKGEYTYQFNFSKLSKGVYFLFIDTGDETLNYKIIYH